ncbi:peptidase C14, caspase domain-containing protein [Lactarius vividus]|nr:peptidase C14, caspase domain-containing protein [Lactarius vividus]
MEPHGHPDFQFSRCTGRKRAVCIGVNYTGQNSQLDGCVNDAKNVYHFLIDRLGFRTRDIIRLTDEARDPRNLPTRANILGAMRWLVRGARKHDSLFFHYSGHGAQVRDRNGDEVDGFDEVIFPVDYSQTGTIIDDELHSNLVKPLPPGCRLTAIIDVRGVFSRVGALLTSSSRVIPDLSLVGIILQCRPLLLTVCPPTDIPFVYHSDGRVKSSSITKEFLREKSTPADVICWSGSADSGTAFGEKEGGIAVGAMSYAFLRVLRNNPRPTYEDLLRDLRRATRKYHQKPQLSASHQIVSVLNVSTVGAELSQDLGRRFVI